MCLTQGQATGAALASVLFGDVNPSARLPFTIPNTENEMGFTPMQYPGINLENVYSERFSIGYRWYDVHNVKPAFEFGFGLSYTKFDYKNLVISDKSISLTLTNTGKRSGCESVQLYLGFPYGASEPPKQLKGF